MKTTWIVVALAGALVVGCGENKKGTEGAAAKTPGSAPARRAPIKPLPGTEAVQSLLTGVGKSAAPSDRTATALGGLFGNGGVLGAGPSQGMGVVGAAKPVDIGAPDPGAVGAAGDDGADPADPADTRLGNDPGTTPPPQVTLPPPAHAGGDCAAVATRIGELTRAMTEAELANADQEARDMARSMIDSTIAAMVEMIGRACSEQQWPQELKDCLLTGASVDALQACERFVTPAMKQQLEATATAPAIRPSTPAPAWDGASTDCAATAAHAAALAEWELSVAPPDLRAGAADMLGQLRSGVESACTAGAWPEAQRRCVLTAPSLDAMNTCGG